MLSCSLNSFILYASLTIALYALSWTVYTTTLHPLASIPGPWLAKVSRLWIVVNTLRGDMDQTQRYLHSRYGRLVRIAPNEIACAEPDAIKNIYRLRDPLKKTDFYPVWGNKTFSKYPDNFSVTDERLHSDRRRIVNNVYAMSSVLQSEQFIDRCSLLLMDKLGSLADKNEAIDLGEWLQSV